MVWKERIALLGPKAYASLIALEFAVKAYRAIKDDKMVQMKEEYYKFLCEMYGKDSELAKEQLRSLMWARSERFPVAMSAAELIG